MYVLLFYFKVIHVYKYILNFIKTTNFYIFSCMTYYVSHKIIMNNCKKLPSIIKYNI